MDQALVSDLGVADGRTDPQVYVLDPCCGTGTYVVEALRVIRKRLKAKGPDALAAQRAKRAMTERVFGFEILPAPFVVAHLQIGLLPALIGAPLEERERAGVFLTNALTGWKPRQAEDLAAGLLGGLDLPDVGQELRHPGKAADVPDLMVDRQSRNVRLSASAERPGRKGCTGVLGLAAVDRAHVKRVSEDEHQPLARAQVGEPASGR